MTSAIKITPAAASAATLENKRQDLGSVSGTVSVDLSQGWAFTATITANTVFNLTNLGATSLLAGVEAIVTQGNSGGHTIAFELAGTPISINWDTSVAEPATTQAGAVVIFDLLTPDGGTTWFGSGAPVRLDQSNTWTAVQVFGESIQLPIVTPGTTTTSSQVTNNAVTDSMAATAMGVTTSAIVEGMLVYDATSKTVVVRTATAWERLHGTGDQSTVTPFTRPVLVYANVGSSSQIFGARVSNPGTAVDSQDRWRWATDSSGNPEMLLGPGSFSPDAGFKRSGNSTVTTVGVWIAQAGAPMQTPTKAGQWTDADVTVGTVADGMHAVDTTDNLLDYRSGGSWWAAAPGPREQDALNAQGWLAWNYDSMLASLNSQLVSGSLYVVRMVMPSGKTVSNVVLGLFAAGSGFTANESAVGLYDASGNLLTGSGDMGNSTYLGAGAASSGYTKPCPLTTPQALKAGQVVYAAVLATATTMPKLAATSGGVSGAYQTGASGYRRFGIAGTALTALPSTITPNSLANGAISLPFVALS